MPKSTQLDQNRLLAQLDGEILLAIQPNLMMVPMLRGVVLHLPGGNVDHVYFPVSGMISILTVMATGDQIETAIVGREGVVGASIGSFGPNSFGQATVQIPGEAWRLASARFLELFESSARFRRIMNGFQALILVQAQQSAACHALHSVEARLCRWLLQSQDVIESDAVKLTQEFLSHMLGVQRTAVSICAKSLQDRGLIEYWRGNIKILHRAGLEERACECYGVIYEQIKGAMKAADTPSKSSPEP